MLSSEKIFTDDKNKWPNGDHLFDTIQTITDDQDNQIILIPSTFIFIKALSSTQENENVDDVYFEHIMASIAIRDISCNGISSKKNILFEPLITRINICKNEISIEQDASKKIEKQELLIQYLEEYINIGTKLLSHKHIGCIFYEAVIESRVFLNDKDFCNLVGYFCLTIDTSFFMTLSGALKKEMTTDHHQRAEKNYSIFIHQLLGLYKLKKECMQHNAAFDPAVFANYVYDNF